MLKNKNPNQTTYAMISLPNWIRAIKAMKIFTFLFGILLTFVFLGTILSPSSVHAQSFNSFTGSTGTSQQNNDSKPLTQLEILDKTAQDTQISQLNERQLRDLVQQLENENITLEKDILTLSNKRDELKNKLTKFSQLKDGQTSQENGQENGQDNDTPTIQNLNSEIASANEELLTVETDLAKKESKEQANRSTINQAKQRLQTLNTTVEDNVKDLRTQLFDLFSRYSFYFGLILIYFALLQLINNLTDRFIKAEIAKEIIKFVITFLVIVATVITLLVAFVGNLTYLLAGLGVVSAALVVALQDFVSSLFAFFWIKIRRIYKTKDVIDINTGSTGIVTGVVLNIGLFRTTLKELYGVGELNAERSSGRTASVPNNVVLKSPVINYTQDNRILWHVMQLTITFESDFELAKKQLELIMKKQFEYAVDHKDQLLDDAFNLEYVYAPKVFMSIAGNGPQFDIWFAARYGHYREIKEEISAAILHSFRVHGIDLAYATSRVIPTPIDGKPYTTIAFKDPGLVDK